MRNTGSGGFGAPSTIAGTDGIQSLATGDLNRDGKADLVGMTANGVIVARGNGAGGFTAGSKHPATIGGQAQALVLDVNGDGKLDVAVPTFNAVQTLLGNGDGTLRSGPSTQLSAGAVSALSRAKLKGDAISDLYAVDGCSGTLFALRGSATGTFTVTGQLPASGLVPEDVVAVDLNSDGADDAAVIGSFSFTLATALSNGQGGFAGGYTADYQSGGPGPTSVGASDLNHDGNADLVVSDVANPGSPSLMVFAGNGTVHPSQAGTFAVGAFPQDPAIADYNGDGKPDIAVAGPGSLSVLINTTP